jgi:SSS family transporter
LSTEHIILIGVVIYLITMLTVGFLAAKRSDTTEGFMVASRRMPLFLCAATVMATWFGGGAMMGSAGAAYEGGFLAVIADPFGGALALILFGLFFARITRRMKLLTTVDYMERRFGPAAAMVVTIGTLTSNIGWTGGLLVAFGFVFNTFAGVPVTTGIVVGAAIVVTYTAVGGMWAVAVTDFIQMLIIILGLIILLAAVLVDTGGWSNIAPQLAEGTFRMVPAEHTAERWLNYFRMWFIYGLADLSSQTLMQRSMAAKSERTAQNAFYLAGFSYLAVGLVAVMLGIIASVILPGLDSPESVIPTLALNQLHPILIAFFVGALLSAIMSSADSSLLAAASIIGENVLPYFRRNPDDRQKLLATRLAIPLCGGLALLIALKAQVIYQLMMDANSVLLVSVVVPFIAGIWWKRANRSGVLAAMAAGFVVWALATLWVPEWPGDMIGLLACLVTLLIVSPLTQRSDPPRPVIDGDGNAMTMTDRLGRLALFGRSAKSGPEGGTR